MKDKLLDFLIGELQKSAESLQWHIDKLCRFDENENKTSSNIDVFSQDIKDLKDYILWLKNLKNDQTTENKL